MNCVACFSGDRLLRINDVTLLGVTHKHAVETLRHASVTSRLVLVRGVTPTPVQRQPTPTSPTPATTPSIMDSRLLSPSTGTYVTSDTDTPIPNDTYGTSDTDTQVPNDTYVTSDTDTPVPADTPSVLDEQDDIYAFVNTGKILNLSFTKLFYFPCALLLTF